MHALALSGPDVTALRDRLVAELANRGPIAVVERSARVEATPGGVATAYRLDGDGRAAVSSTADLDTALEALAPDHELALVSGFDDVDLPRVVVGEEDPEALVAAPTLAELETAAVEAALEDLEPIETLESLVARAKRADDAHRAGAIATFTGRVRAKDEPDDVETTELEFEKYEGVADERLAALASELSARDGVFEVVMHHKTGVVEAGEDIVFVVVLAGHREEAFETVADGINRLKAEVPFFKKEVTVEEDFWVHQRP